MAVLTGYLPVEQGVACLTALRRHTDTRKADGDRRSRDQIMADTLVERLTGQTTAADVNIELHLLMPLDALLNPHNASAPRSPVMDRYRPGSPATSSTPLGAGGGGGGCSPPPPTDRSSLRIGSAAAFDGPLATLIRLRDRTCRDPTATHPSATSTRCIATPPADPPPWPTDVGCAPAATSSAKCPAGPPPSPTTADTPNRTPSPSPPPPATATPAAHPNRLSAREVPPRPWRHQL
jgi:hypothetical protein